MMNIRIERVLDTSKIYSTPKHTVRYILFI